jgi:SAM-dependent methyltransferase
MTLHAVDLDELVLYTACPLCDCEELSFLLSSDCTTHPSYRPGMSSELNWHTCDRCGHVFRNGYYTEQAAALIFAEVDADKEVGQDLERWRVMSAKMIERVLPYRNSGAWLDVGFGNGSLLFTAAEFGFRPIGCDLRSKSVETMKNLGIEAYCADVSDLQLGHTVSVVSMGDVLEHIPYPKEALHTSHRLLDDGGVLLLSMPNFETMVWRALDMNAVNPYWGEIEHYHNFSRTRLYEVLAETGFEVLSYGISERYRTCMEVLARKA